MPRKKSSFFFKLKKWLGFTMLEVMILVMVIGVVTALAIPSLKGFFEAAQLNKTVTELRVAMSNSQRGAIRNRNTCATSIVVQTSSSADDFQSALGSSCRDLSIPELPNGISLRSNLTHTPMNDIVAIKRGWWAALPFSDVFSPSHDESSLSRSNISSDGLSPSVSPEGGAMMASATSTNDDDDDNDDDDENERNVRPPSQRNRPAIDNNSRSSSHSRVSSTLSSAISKAHDSFSIDNCKNWNGCRFSQRAHMGVVDLIFNHQGMINFDVTSGSDGVSDSSGIIVAMLPDQPKRNMKCIVISRRIGLTRVGNYQGGLSPMEITNEGECTTLKWDQQ